MTLIYYSLRPTVVHHHILSSNKITFLENKTALTYTPVHSDMKYMIWILSNLAKVLQISLVIQNVLALQVLGSTHLASLQNE